MAACSRCGQDNPEIAQFCLACGTALVRRPRGEERKVVTVLFCDLVGFTAASEHADPEDVRSRLQPYHSMARKTIEGFGGTVEKFIGDAVMAVFGAPVTHEDDPERAVRAGLALLEGIEELNEHDPSPGLQVRIGINTGEVLAGLEARPERGEGMVTGDVVNTASRLQTMAPVGGVVVGEGTFRATERVVEYEALSPVVVKGKSDAVRIWQAIAARARFGTDVTRSFTAPFVGRDLELNLLAGIFDRCVRELEPHLVTIVGEPGIGKSRLIAELGSFVDDRPELVRWRQGRCLPYGEGITFWALGEIVKSEAGILETDGPDAALEKLEATLSNVPDAPWLRQRLRPLVGLDAPDAAREENFTAWRRFLEALAEDNPAVFVFEDLHWADDALLAFLEHVADSAEGLPMLMIATARPELNERAPTWTSAARNATRINLNALTESDTARLIGGLLERAVLPAEVQGTILSRSGGNPLYAEEFVRLLQDRSILRTAGEAWASNEGDDASLPSSVEALIAARLDTLAPERKTLLQDAAVVGKVFWLGALASMRSADSEELAQALHELSRKELVRSARRSSMEGEREYAFWHALIRDVCYGQIPRTRRAELHLRAASWIETVAGERVADHAEILASHFLAALDLSAGLSPEDAARAVEGALRYLTLAGDRALGVDVEAAERTYARALSFTREGEPQHAELLVRWGEALRQRGRFQDAARAFEDAIGIFRRHNDPASQASALLKLSAVRAATGDARFKDAVGSSLALLEPLGPSPALVSALTDLAATEWFEGDPRTALSSAERAVELARTIGAEGLARALGFRGAIRAALGDGGGMEDMQAGFRAAIAQGLSREAALIQFHLGEALDGIEGPRAVLDICSRGAEFAEQRGVEEFVLAFHAARVEALADLGLWDEAMRLADTVRPRLELHDSLVDLLPLLATQARIMALRGDARTALALIEPALDRARASDSPQLMPPAVRAASLAHVLSGDVVNARALLAEMEGTAGAKSEDSYRRVLFDAVGIALATEDVDLAHRLVRDVQSGHPIHQLSAIAAAALIAEHEGDSAAAAASLAEAAQAWKRFDMPWERASALLALTRCLVAAGRTEQADDAAREALVIFRRLGVNGAAAEVEAMRPDLLPYS